MRRMQRQTLLPLMKYDLNFRRRKCTDIVLYIQKYPLKNDVFLIISPKVSLHGIANFPILQTYLLLSAWPLSAW